MARTKTTTRKRSGGKKNIYFKEKVSQSKISQVRKHAICRQVRENWEKEFKKYMTTPRIRNRYLHFGGKIKKKRKLTRRKKTRGKRDGAAFLGPILASPVAPVLKGIIGKIF